MVSGLTFRSLINFGFIFVYGVKRCSNLIVLHVACPVFPPPLVEETVFSTFYQYFYANCILYKAIQIIARYYVIIVVVVVVVVIRRRISNTY